MQEDVATGVAHRLNDGLTGLLPVNKPAGMTSKDVSRKLAPILPRRIKIGHVGTLDPIATGVLPIVLGRATRLQDLLLDMPKTYVFEIAFGYETDTLDTEGEVVRTCEEAPIPTADQIKRVLPLFIGDVEQVPPMFSAVKYKGKPLYKYAREDRDNMPDLQKLSRTVKVYSLEFVGMTEAGVRLSATSSRGTYVRSLARDIAAELGTCGTITMLTRTYSAGVDVSQCINLEDLVSGRVSLGEAVMPIETLAAEVPFFRSLAPVWTQRLRQGQGLKLREDLFDRAADGQNPAEILNRDLLLLSDRGRVFGLGMAVSVGSGEFMVNMKRGLQ